MKQKSILYHAGGWLLYISYNLVGIWRNGDVAHLKISLLLQFSLCLSLAGVFYYCFLFVYPQLLKKRKLLLLVVALLAVPLVFSAARYFFEELLYPLLFGYGNYWGKVTLTQYLGDNIYRSLPMIVISAAIWNTQDAFKQQQENNILRKEKLQAELAFLKSQLNPHFLYNTLNYIYSLAYPVSDKLANAIIKLSNLVRYMLNDSKDGMIDLQKEVDYLTNYIEIYQLRFEDHFYVSFKAEGDIAGKQVASLILIPFVENAFKHGVVNDPQRPVRIQLKVIGSRLMFTVSNKINRNQQDHSSGVGLLNIKRRLELIYPRQYELLIGENGLTYKATINIEL